MKTILLAILLGTSSAFCSDIKPPEYRQVTIIGLGSTSFNACNDANTRMYNSKKRFTDQCRVDLRPLPNGGYISIITRTEKIIH
jgi:hypothetical protein